MRRRTMHRSPRCAARRPPNRHDGMPERIQKILAGLGYGSRRQVEEWIRAGRISINGRTAVLGDTAGPGDALTLDGRAVAGAAAPTSRVILYNKPEGEICTRSDPQGRPTIFDRLPAPGQGR